MCIKTWYRYKQLSIVFLLICSGVVGCSGIDTHETDLSYARMDMEDYAIKNIINILAYSSYLDHGDVEKHRELLDIQLNDALDRIRRYQGDMSSDEFMVQKIMVLNSAALLWEERRPFQVDPFQPNAENASWIGNWQKMTKKNMELLQWAKQQCQGRQELHCIRIKDVQYHFKAGD